MREELVEAVIGVDAHKRTHTLVACDALGRELGSKTVTATTDGHFFALDWARRWAVRRWAVEDCRHLTRTLERDLLRAGEQLVRVPAQLMAGARRSAREPGKSDPIDALAVARAAWRESGLPTARLDGPARQARLLVDHRDDLVRERVRVQSRIRWHLHEIAPDLDVPARGLRRRRIVDAVAALLAEREGSIVRIARELLDRIRELNQRVVELEREIKQLIVRVAQSLLDIPGCGALTAAKIVGETAGARRFHSRSAYARWNGTAPQPAWSGNTRRFRLSRGGNRQVNSALHRIGDYAGPQRDPRARLPRPPHQAGQQPHRGAAALAPSPLRRRLPHPSARRGRRPHPRHSSPSLRTTTTSTTNLT